MQPRLDANQVSAPPLGAWELGGGDRDLVSYVIPTFNAGQYIEETLESCFAQDYRPLEIVVVDDGSTDQTRNIVQECKNRREDDQFRVVYLHQENAGVNAARNRGLRASRGEYVGLLDADDLLPRRRTSLLRKFVSAHDADLVYGPCVRFSHSDEVRPYLNGDDAATAATAEPASCDPATKWVPNVWSFLMTRRLAEQVGPFAESVRTCCPDVDYTIRIRLCRPRMFRTSAIVNLYRAVPGSMASKNRPEAIAAWMLAMQLITQALREHGITDAASHKWVSGQYLQIAVWALRIRLRREASDACGHASEFSAGRAKVILRLISGICRLPLVVPVLSSTIRLRSSAWMPVRNKLLSLRGAFRALARTTPSPTTDHSS